MKSILFLLLAAISQQPLDAQGELASATSMPSIFHASSETALASEPGIAAIVYLADEQVVVNLGRGFGKTVQFQVLTPSTGLLFEKEIPAGQKKIRVDLAGLPDGHYTLRMMMGNKVWVKQVTKG